MTHIHLTQPLGTPPTQGLVASPNPEATHWLLTENTLPPGLTFSRASQATHLSATGLITTKAMNAARFESNPSTLAPRGLLLEGPRTNQIINSEDFTAASWTKTATVTGNAGLAPDGTTNADLLEDNSAVAVQTVQRSYPITSSALAYAGSVFLKAGTSSVASVRASFSGGTLTAPELVVNLATGAAQWRTGFAGTAFNVQALPNDWYRVNVVATDNATANTVASLEVRPAFAATYSPTLDVAATGNCLAWGAQMEGTGVDAVTFASSYISTGAAAATRAADSATLTELATLGFNPNAGTIVLEWEPMAVGAAVANGVLFSINDGTASNLIKLGYTAAGTALVAESVVAGTTTTAGLMAGTLALGQMKAALAWQSNSQALVMNGGSAVTNAASIPAAGVLNRLQVATQNPFIWLRSLTYYPRHLSVPQLQTLTNL